MFCPMCGAPNEEDATFCGNCGAVLSPGEAATDAGSEVTQVEAGIETAKEPLEEAVPGPLPEEEALPSAPLPEKAEVLPPPAYAPPPAAPAAGLPTSGLAIASLILGIGGLTFAPLLGSIVAIILGYMARNDIRLRSDQVSGDGMAKAGLILGWIGVGLTVLGLVLFGGITACSVCGALGGGNY